MKVEHLLVAVVRLFAIALLIQVVRTTIQMVVFAEQNNFDFEFALVAYSGSIVALLLVAVILWKFPVTVSRKIGGFPEIGDAEARDVNTMRLVQSGAIILGLYFLFYVISDLAYWGFYLVALSRAKDLFLEFRLEDKASFFATVVEALVAITLILGSKKISQIILKIRYGTDVEP